MAGEDRLKRVLPRAFSRAVRHFPRAPIAKYTQRKRSGGRKEGDLSTRSRRSPKPRSPKPRVLAPTSPTTGRYPGARGRIRIPRPQGEARSSARIAVAVAVAQSCRRPRPLPARRGGEERLCEVCEPGWRKPFRVRQHKAARLLPAARRLLASSSTSTPAGPPRRSRPQATRVSSRRSSAVRLRST